MAVSAYTANRDHQYSSASAAEAGANLNKMKLLIESGHPDAQAKLEALPLAELEALSKRSKPCADAVSHHLATREREANQRVAAIEGHTLSHEEWAATKPRDPGHPAISYIECASAIALAEPGTVTASISETLIDRPPSFDHPRARYHADGQLILPSKEKVIVRWPSGESFEVVPPGGWNVHGGYGQTFINASSITARPFTCLLQQTDNGPYALLTQRYDQTDPSITPLSLPDTLPPRYSPNGISISTQGSTGTILNDAIAFSFAI